MAGKIELDMDKIAQLKKQGKSDGEVINYLATQGIKISKTTLSHRLIEYYNKRGEERVRVKNKVIEITDEEMQEIENMIENGYSYSLVLEYLENIGKTMSVETLIKKLDKYSERMGKGKIRSKLNRPGPRKGFKIKKGYQKKPQKKLETIIKNSEEREYEDPLKEIFFTGITVQEFYDKFGYDEKEIIEAGIEKLKIIAQHAVKKEDEWICDDNFTNLIYMIDKSSEYLMKYENYINNYVSNGVCQVGGIDKIRNTALGKNEDILMYILLRMNVKYRYGYDIKALKELKKQYDIKLNKYINRLHSIENNRANNKTNNENSSKSEKHEEVR